MSRRSQSRNRQASSNQSAAISTSSANDVLDAPLGNSPNWADRYTETALNMEVFRNDAFKWIISIAGLLAAIMYLFLVAVVFCTLGNPSLMPPTLYIPTVAAFSVIPTTLIVVIIRVLSPKSNSHDESSSEYVPLRAIDYLNDNRP